MAVKTLDDLLAEGVSGRGVLVRSDLNVPLDDDGNITDPGRIIASVPTLKALSDAGAKVVVTAHLGRPKDGPDPKFSLAPVADGAGRAARPARPAGRRRGRHRRAGPRRGADRRRRPAAGEHPLRPARDQQGRRRAAGAGQGSWSNWSATDGGFRVRRLRRGAPQAGLGLRRRDAAAALRGHAGGRRDQGARAADQLDRAAVRGGARRVEGVRQARRHRERWRPRPTASSSAAACASPSLPHKVFRSATRCCEEEHDRHLPQAARRPTAT